MDVLARLLVNLIATVHPLWLAFWFFVFGAAFAWLVNDALVVRRLLRDQRNREAELLAQVEGRA